METAAIKQDAKFATFDPKIGFAGVADNGGVRSTMSIFGF